MRPAMRSIFAMLRLCPVVLAAILGVGCTAFSNPTLHVSVPVNRLPEEVKGKPRNEQQDVNQTLLRMAAPAEHIIDANDTLGILFEGIISPERTPPPIKLPEPGAASQTIGLGYPFPVFENGTIQLPLIEPINVKGLSITQAQEKIRKAYLERGILRAAEDQYKIIVTLYRPRHFHVLVVRQDNSQVTVGPGGGLGGRRGSGIALDLPIYENDVLTALARSGGLPGDDAKNEVIIQRGAAKGELTTYPSGPIPGVEVIRIPLRLRPGEPLPFKREDVVLRNGDILFIQQRDAEVYYTAGLIGPGEYPIPRNYDLDVLTAVIQARGAIISGGQIFSGSFQNSLVGQGIGIPSPSSLTVLRKAPGGRQITIRVDLNRAAQDPRERILVQPGDVLFLQETMGEAFTRYVLSTFRTFTSVNIFAAPLNNSRLTVSAP